MSSDTYYVRDIITHIVINLFVVCFAERFVNICQGNMNKLCFADGWEKIKTISNTVFKEKLIMQEEKN